MRRFGRFSLPSRVKRLFKMAVIMGASSCAGDCDQPVALDTVQAPVRGTVTLNGEPLPGVVVASEIATDETDGDGVYEVLVGGLDFPFEECVGLSTAPYSRISAGMFPGLAPCPLVSSQSGASFDWTIEHVMPGVGIADPEDDAEVGSPVALRASLSGTVTVNGVAAAFLLPVNWSSSLDGDIGTPSLSTTAALTPGTHTITATYTDLFDVTVSDAITVRVVDPTNEPPTATITAPSDGFSFDSGVPLDFAGSATDPEDGALTGASLAWTSSQEGDIGAGTSFSRVMAEGSHIIVLSATDGQGAVGTDTVRIHITSGDDGTIEGLVTIGGDGLFGVPVALSGAATASTTTTAWGGYVFSGLAAGTYTITITPPPGVSLPTEQTVTLGVNETVTVNFSG